MVFKLHSLFYLSICVLVGEASCGSIAAWWNSRGPSIILQDDDTGGIRYSLCNGNYTPILPDDTTMTMPLDNNPPKKNSSLSATGWMDGTTSWVSMFYMDNNDDIVNSLLKCDWDTGRWQNTGDYVISNGAPKVAPTSTVAATLLGSTDGYRVFYNDLSGVMHEIGYTSDSQKWGYYGVVSHDVASSQAISSVYSGSDGNITLVRPRDEKNIGVSRYYSDETWHLESFPEPLTKTGNQSTNATSASDLKLDSIVTSYSLPSWDGTATSIAAGIDNSLTRYVFYIGTDNKLYQVYNGNSGWLMSTRADDSSWPQADTAGGQLAIASDYTTQAIRLYYMSGGKVVEAASNNGQWAASTVLPSSNTTQAQTTSSTGTSASATPSSPSADDDEGGLSGAAKAGLSAGVTLGVIALGGMLAAFCFLRRRQRKLDEAAKQGEGMQYMSPASAHTYPATYSQSGTYVNTENGAFPPGHPGSPQDTYTGQNGYPMPTVPSYAQAQGYPQQTGPYGGDHSAVPQTAYTQPQPGLVPQDGWTYPNTSPTEATQQPGQQQFQQQFQYFQPQPQHTNPQEMPEQRRPVEMMGEGHYKEAP
ncbi:Uu.00g118740.m01.CDS01 [Anthostomella pinea]|uniref:Uu.00g118740.m01.CDS01 n=1 Tax=Anthostomella pinea TaxID=933095 RepID=A0AAI8VHF7_9PEZI|nr:Uu.00g118740.m01.CDS01 [Anthostomella pinea]